MKTKVFLTVPALLIIISAIGQKPSIELTFTSTDNAAYVQLDSIKIMNRTQGGDTVLYYPDTLLVLDYQVGISENNIDDKGFKVFQNYPNPVIVQTTISFFVPEKDRVKLIITDMQGRALIETERILDQGYHSCIFTPGNGSLFISTVQWRDKSSSIKIIKNNPVSDKENRLEYIGNDNTKPLFKISSIIQNFNYSLGDDLLYIGYFDTLQSGIFDTPETNETYTFQFAYNIPCPGQDSLSYEGQWYHTVQIFSQCWLKENLNVGIQIDGSLDQTDNGIVEKYCYENQPDSCTKYGGLYLWGETLQYTLQQGVQGICPTGWHIPTDEEWKVLEGTVDSQYGVGDDIWNLDGERGIDAGTSLKTISGWSEEGNGTDAFDFSAMPGGMWYNCGFTWILGTGIWRTSTGNYTFAWHRAIYHNQTGIWRSCNDFYEHLGISVRCIKD